MKGRESLSGSNYGEGVIPPSTEDIARLKNPSEPSPPLLDTHGRNSSLAGTTAVAASVIFVPTPTGDISFQAPNGEYCTIEFPPDQGFSNEDWLRFNVGFYEPSNPDSEHRVVIKNKFGVIVNPDNLSKFSTSALINGVTLNKRMSNGEYTMEVREKAVDFIFGDEGKSCETNVRLGSEGKGGPIDKNGNPILSDEQITRAESLTEIFDAFVDEYNNEPVEKNDQEALNQCMDLITAWVDALGIPRSTVIGLEVAKNLYFKPHPITGDYFDTITYEPDMEVKPGDIVVWNERVGNSAGHAAIATGEEDLYFSQNYPAQKNPANNTAHLQKIGKNGLMAILRPRGFGPPEQPDRTKAPEKSDPKARIDAILAVEPGDSDERIALKTFLSWWFTALTTRQIGQDENIDRFLDVSITNFNDLEANASIQNLFQYWYQQDTTLDLYLEIDFLSVRMDGENVEKRVGRGVIDRIYLYIDGYDEWDLKQKGYETAFYGNISFLERSQAILQQKRINSKTDREKYANDRTLLNDVLPPMPDDWTWAATQINFEVYRVNGTWKMEINYPYGGRGSDQLEDYLYGGRNIEDIIKENGWKGINLATRIFAYPKCVSEQDINSQEYEGCVQIDS